MKQKQNLPLPLMLVKEFEKAYPKCWELVELLREGRGKDLPNWNDLCYVPITGTNEILKNVYHEKGHEKSKERMLYPALASWRQYKEIYTFSPELYDMLVSQAEDIVIPMEILFQIPYPCIYCNKEGEEDKGFFVFFEQDAEELELRFTEIEKGKNGDLKPKISWVHLKQGYTISDGIQDDMKLVKKNLQEKYNVKDEKQLEDYVNTAKKMLYERISKHMQLVLYICAENAEIEENPQQKPITRKPSAGTKPKDTFREIQKWDIGVKISKKIRMANKDEKESTEHTETQSIPGASKRPHTRRGHWHHYWTGSRNGNERKLILKWVAPTFVGGNTEDTITTINVRE